jgi:hypothetical protein
MWASNFVIGRAIPPSLPPVRLSFWCRRSRRVSACRSRCI